MYQQCIKQPQVAKLNDIDDPFFHHELNIKRHDISLYRDAKKSLDGAFTLACVWGHYDVARWLLMVKPDIKADFTYLFGVSCQQGYLIMAQFLLSVRPNEIDIMWVDNYAFHNAQKNSHTDVCDWLYSLNPDYCK